MLRTITVVSGLLLISMTSAFAIQVSSSMRNGVSRSMIDNWQRGFVWQLPSAGGYLSDALCKVRLCLGRQLAKTHVT